MSNNIERLLLAATISLASFFFSYYWYISGKPKDDGANLSNPVARLAIMNNDVQRRRAKRVIWQAISQGDRLYEREAIRTMAGATAEIIFLDEDGNDKGTVIQLDPDSVIVLETTGDNVSLNFLKGNIFIAGQDPTSELSIKTGTNTIKAGGGELNLSKASEKEDVELQVFKGTATVQAGNETIELEQNQTGKLGKELKIEENLIEVTYPPANENLFLNLKKGENVSFQWKPLEPGYKVQLYLGKSPKKLKAVEEVDAVIGETGQIKARVKAGRIYWRLEASLDADPTQKSKSPVFKNKVVAIKPPLIIAPKKKDRIQLKKSAPELELAWTNPMQLKRMQIQLWRQNKEKEIIPGSEINIDAEGTKHIHSFSSSGVYSMRVTGFLNRNGKDEPISSPTRRFAIKLGEDLVPPELEKPIDKEYLSHAKVVESGIFMTWNKAPGAEKYVLSLTTPGAKEAKEIEVYDEGYRIENAKPGLYFWTVATFNKEGKTSKFAEQRQFNVEDVPKLAWKKEGDIENSYYIGDEPRLNAAWKNFKGQNINYKVIYALDGEWDRAKKADAKDSNIQLNVGEKGMYLVQIQATNNKGRVIAQTTKKKFKVTEFPFLPAPEFVSSLPKKLKADIKGNVKLKWEKVAGAEQYVVRLKDKDKKLVKELKVSGTSTNLSSLIPGKYRVFLYTEDKYGRVSKNSAKRLINVDNKSDIRAPSGFKGIKIKGIKLNK